MNRALSHQPLRIGCALLLAGAISACVNTAGLQPPESPNEFAEQTVQLQHQIWFEAGRSELTATERARLQAFLAEADPRRDGKLRLAVAADQPQRLAALRMAIAAEGRGVAGSLRLVPPDDGAVVAVEHAVTLPTRCIEGDVWSGAVMPSGTTIPLGCSSSLNLQAMIERAADLTHGREPGPSAAQPSADLARGYLSRWSGPNGGQPAAGDGAPQASSRQPAGPPVPDHGFYE